MSLGRKDKKTIEIIKRLEQLQIRQDARDALVEKNCVSDQGNRERRQLSQE